MKRNTISLAAMIAAFAVGVIAAGISYLQPISLAEGPPEIFDEELTPEQGNPPRTTLEMVFVLDTTGSMGGLLEGAKQKIWSIVNEVQQKQSRPSVRVGLIAYRDRTDAYVTQITPLTSDLDKVYSDLMDFEAAGGGDHPE